MDTFDFGTSLKVAHFLRKRERYFQVRYRNTYGNVSIDTQARLEGDDMINTDLLPSPPWNLIFVLVQSPAAWFIDLCNYLGERATAAKNLVNLLGFG